jgi:hypothetical protein
VIFAVAAYILLEARTLGDKTIFPTMTVGEGAPSLAIFPLSDPIYPESIGAAKAHRRVPSFMMEVTLHGCSLRWDTTMLNSETDVPKLEPVSKMEVCPG